ncbi:WRKY transcription factor 22-like [Chenopodium quinoa]|uniref:WRKY transcription factor 22-like n=1 Tax=Chenopodium quinoa TaxID=63459 RepID=UPI000B78467A|nr:WRKY transcription factor 22-like [Chenopodium quinoa]
METPPDWDLLAVVRSCCSTTTTTTTTTTADLEPSPSIPPPPPSSSSSQFTLLPQLPQQQQQPPKQEPYFSTSPCSTTSGGGGGSGGILFQFSNPFEPCTSTTSFELQDICKPLICSTATTANSSVTIHNTNSFQSLSSASLASPVSSPSSVITGRSFGIVEQQQHQQQTQLRGLIKPSHVIFGTSSPSNAGNNASQTQRTKKRKNLMKKVCHVPAEGLSSDMWAWRKYGQKPIKGSPYPRGYYRCSSSKGCLARKQVERNRSDPKMFIVTYTSEHNHPMPTHRNSLAGSTRQKPLTTTGTPPEQPTCSSPSAASLSPLTEKSESKTEGDELIKEEDDTSEMALSDLMLNDDFYVGFEQIDGGSDGSDCFSDHFSPSSAEFPWLSNSSSTAAAAGGS